MIRVLIVDDSSVARRSLAEGLSKCADIEVVAFASDPYVARDRILELRPDVITLDIQMPRMDGLSFLSKLMRYHPMPVVVVSGVTGDCSAHATRALELGAIEVIDKPGSARLSPDVFKRLAQAIRAAAASQIQLVKTARNPSFTASSGFAPPLQTSYEMIAIGASTGGTTAIETVLSGLPATGPAVVIAQHMPEHFTGAFAEKLNSNSHMEVREARDGDTVTRGVALVAPGGRHMLVQRSGSQCCVRTKDGPAVHHQKPSVDVLFHSVARSAGAGAIGVLLTGMGADGAAGLLAMRETGAHTIVQDEESCVVFGMPREAIRLGAAREILPVSRISRALMSQLLRHRLAA